jgi:hypothetical protein
MRKFIVTTLLVGVLALGGCVSAEDKALISTGSAVGDGDIANWDKLSDVQKKTAHWKLTRGYHVLDHGINGVGVSPEFQATDPPWVASTAPVVTPR